MAFVLTSPAFEDGDELPAEHTCDGRDRSPPLAWTDPPPGTRSFALLVEEPGEGFAHWVVWDLPASLRALPPSIAQTDALAVGGTQGRGDFRRIGWTGPCPGRGAGERRCVFALHALDVAALGLGLGATGGELRRALVGHVLATARLEARYARPQVSTQ